MKHFIWKILLRMKNPSCTINTSRVARTTRLSQNVYLGFGSVVAADKIGRYTFINDYSLIDRNVSSIGNFCSIAYNVRIGLGNHPTDWVSSHPFAYQAKYKLRHDNIAFSSDDHPDTIIGNDVWIGANATILAGVKVGDGALIGAHSLVTKDVEPFSIVIGSPARHLRFRFDKDSINKLNEIKWWEWNNEKIRANINLFSDPEKFIAKLETN